MSTEQHTNCAVCGKHKHTPLRRDEMGGYVCLTCIEAELNKLNERNAQLNKELDAGDSWAWIRAKFEKSKDKFRWYKPRTDGFIGTRYEVMGWLHCLFSDTDPTVFIDITLEHQKRTDEAEAARNTLLDMVRRVKGSMEVIPWGERPASWDCYIREFDIALKAVKQ